MLLSLGSWQLYRLNWKLNLLSEIENSLKNNPVEFSKVDKKNYLRIKTSGIIDFNKQIYLYNLNESGKPGFEVINPIIINNENYLINRGWIPFNKKDKPEVNLINESNIVGTLKLQHEAMHISMNSILYVYLTFSSLAETFWLILVTEIYIFLCHY